MGADRPDSELAALRTGMRVLAVTGTNGKTTTASMLAEIVRASGRTPVLVNTLGMWVGDEQTGDAPSTRCFVATLRRARELGATTLAIEVTSRALQAGFAERFSADVAVFTNLTPDHMDRHGSPERYLAAKAQLFVHLQAGGCAVLNLADHAAPLLAEVTSARASLRGYDASGGEGGRLAVGSPPATLRARAVESSDRGLTIELAASPLADRLGRALRLPVAGAFNADNALAAAVAADAAGLPATAIASGLARFVGVSGRFEVVHRAPFVVIDFAHTPDALERALASARELAQRGGGRLACVFGCGGERDPGKRPAMGRLADRLADVLWLTTDNPRGEDPRAIEDAVIAGIEGNARWHRVPDRRAAIAAAVAWAGPRDAVLVAGRGPELVQHLQDRQVPLSDHEAVRQALTRMAGDRG